LFGRAIDGAISAFDRLFSMPEMDCPPEHEIVRFRFKDNHMIEPLAVPTPEAARLGGVGRSTIYSEISKGNLKIRKVGRRTIVAMDDLKTWLASKVGESA
jgi:excisionase family DNA binding protein